MATYVVGDVQGCFLTFQKLLAEIQFDEHNDKMILVGDVINRGPRSLPMLRFLKARPSSMQMILGNHEIFALALSLGAVKIQRAHTLQDLLAAPDKLELIDFLRAQPLLFELSNTIFVHAGILPSVSIDEAKRAAMELNHLLMSASAGKFLSRFYEKIPVTQKPDGGRKRSLRLALAYLTLLRMCESPSSMDLSYTGTLEKAPKRLTPWFVLRNDPNLTVYFGHWAALGYHKHQRYICLDSGCVWGNRLTAVRLADQKVFQIANIDKV